MATSAADLPSRPPAPALPKGFLEVSAYGKRHLLALTTIAGITDTGSETCTVHLNTAKPHFIFLHQSYDEVMALLANAQQLS